MRLTVHQVFIIILTANLRIFLKDSKVQPYCLHLYVLFLTRSMHKKEARDNTSKDQCCIDEWVNSEEDGPRCCLISVARLVCELLQEDGPE